MLKIKCFLEFIKKFKLTNSEKIITSHLKKTFWPNNIICFVLVQLAKQCTAKVHGKNIPQMLERLSICAVITGTVTKTLHKTCFVFTACICEM